MTGWFASRRILQAQVAYLRLQLEEAKARPQQLVVRPGPPPVPVEADTPEPVEAVLRAQIRALQRLKTAEGALELARDAREWRERATRLCDQLREAETDNERLSKELRALRTPVVLPEQREPGLG